MVNRYSDQNTACPTFSSALRYPFGIGTTSCIYPEQLVVNVAKLAPHVDDIELVLFETDCQSNLPSPAEVKHLGELARSYDLTYTVHLPLDIMLGNEDETIRRHSVVKACNIIALTAPLCPYGIIVHLEQQSFCSTSPEDINHWKHQCARSIRQLIQCVKQPQLLCIETLSYPFCDIEEIIDNLSVSICLDIGHVWYYRQDADYYCKTCLPRTRVVHLHGHAGTGDHTALSLPPDKQLVDFLSKLAAQNYQGLVTLEVFSETDFHQSMRALEGAQALAHDTDIAVQARPALGSAT